MMLGKRLIWTHVVGLLTIGLMLGLALTAQTIVSAARDTGFTEDFRLSDCTFTTRGQNTYFILEPGFQLVLGGRDGGKDLLVTITVLDQTQTIGGIETRVVEEREMANGGLTEISRNFFAICRETNSVFYFGEDVDIYRNDVVVSHDGSWRAGQNGARPGLAMPGMPLLGARYMQEIAPGIAMDRGEIVGLDDELATPAGTFQRCLVVEESNPLESGEREEKRYAPGIGLIQDESLLLLRHSPLPGRPGTSPRPAALQPVPPPSGGEAGRRYFPETQHTLGGGFRAYWEANGGAPIFGLPLSEEFREINAADGKEYTVQYFERARFEHHPEKAGTAYEIELGLLGRQTLVARGWLP